MWVAKAGYIVMSLVFCAAGVACIVNPGLSAAVIGRVLGVAMILFGAVKLVGYCSRDLYRLAFQYDLGFGLLLIALGVLVLLRPAEVRDFLLTALGIAVLTDGLYKVQIAVDAKRFGVSAWWLTLVLAVAAGTVGLALVVPALGQRPAAHHPAGGRPGGGGYFKPVRGDQHGENREPSAAGRD